MKIHKIEESNIVNILLIETSDLYRRACRQCSPTQWHGQLAGYPDGRIEVYGLVYGPSTSEDLYYGRAYLLADISGEDYQYVETDASQDDDPEAYEREIDELIDDDADSVIDMDAVLRGYIEWMARQGDSPVQRAVITRLTDILRELQA